MENSFIDNHTNDIQELDEQTIEESERTGSQNAACGDIATVQDAGRQRSNPEEARAQPHPHCVRSRTAPRDARASEESL